MIRLSNAVRCGAVLLLLAMAACTTLPPAPPKFARIFTPIDAAAQNRMMGRGVNVLGYDPIWAFPSEARFTPDDFRREM